MSNSDQLKMHSPNLVDANIEKIAVLFPNCVTEAEAENGELKKAIDFDLLKQELSQVIVEGEQERYRLDWVGKKESILTANAPIAKTLRPCRDESVNFDTTENLFIEGDNLEALKLLQENYLGKVKMIYIDPPYNTGNDFIYEDDFAESTNVFFERSNQVDEEGNRLIANTESNGRFHSDWLSMMYSRLKLARNLLAENGVIFISCDDNEVHNLRKICDEVFGSNQLIAQICHKARASVSNDKIISSNHNHILLFSKNLDEVFKNRKNIGLDPDLEGFSNPDNDARGPWKQSPVDGPGGAKKGNPFYEFLGVTGYFRYSKETMQSKFDDGLIIKTANGLQQKYFLKDAQASRKTDTTWWDNAGLTSSATRNLQSLMEGKTFDTPKPVELIKRMLKLFTFEDKNNQPLILDFFAGSSTTAHAVIELNNEDKGNRRFIMVQIDEPIDAVKQKEALEYCVKHNLNPNIAALSKERIRRAGKKIVGENTDKEGIRNLDIGFRVLKIDSTNMKDVYYTPDAVKQADMLDLASNIKEDRTSEDLLFQVMLDWGLELSLPIERKTIQGKEVFYVAGNSLVACFDELNFAMVDEMAQDKPLRVVSAERAIQLDHDKTNIKERFKQLSPETEIKFI
ncbi:site-specific DNA-methyltransferase [Acinetobacter bereziniae]|uniref:site-specific DNA-methyltransferase n=1 Tax=Acinetobacter bereziniae TaxID=106648 RepID=UPI00374F8C2C